MNAAYQLHINKPDHLTILLPTSYEKVGLHYHSRAYPQYADRRDNLPI
jgi:hypothetical protein